MEENKQINENTKIDEQIKEKNNEFKRKNKKKLVIIMLIIIIILIITIILLLYNKEDNNKINYETAEHANIETNQTSQNDNEIELNQDNEIELNQDNIIELKLNVNLVNLSEKKYINDYIQFINERKLDLHTRFTKNNENNKNDIAKYYIENGTLTIQIENNEFILKNFNNIKQIAEYTLVEGHGFFWYYILTEDNEIYLLYQKGLDESEKYGFTLYKFGIENVEKIIITEITYAFTTRNEGVIIKTYDEKYYYQNNFEFNELQELIIDESKILTLNEEEHITLKIGEDIQEEIPEIENYDIYSENQNGEHKKNRYKEDIDIILSNEILKIYTEENVYIYNKEKVTNFMVLDKDNNKKNQDNNTISILFITQSQELYRIDFVNNDYKKLIKYNLNNIIAIKKEYKDDMVSLYVKKENEYYKLNLNEEIIYKIK